MDSKGMHWHVYEIVDGGRETILRVYATWLEARAHAEAESRKSKNIWGVEECSIPSDCRGIGMLWNIAYNSAATEAGKLAVLKLAWYAGCYGLMLQDMTWEADGLSGAERRRLTRTIRDLRELAESWEDATDSWVEEAAVSEAERIIKDNDE